MTNHTVLVFGSIFVILPVLYLVFPHGIKVLMRRNFLKKTGRSGCVYLTFDDGPDPNGTPAILELLEKYGVKATFFVIGERVERYSGIVEAIIQAGHDVGSHGYRHAHPFTCNPLRAIFELNRWDRTMNNIGKGWDPSLYRPPYGKFNLVSLAWILAKEKKVVFWDIDPKDYRQTTGESVANYIIDRLSSAKVILLHDGRFPHSTSGCDVTVSALKIFLEHAVGNNVRFKTIREVFR